MSLLLDALQRASKDKEKAAAAAAGSSLPSPPSLHSPIAPAAPEPELTLSDEGPSAASLPTLVQEYVAEPAHSPAPELKLRLEPQVLRSAVPQSPVAPDATPSLELPQEISLDMVPAPSPAPQPAPQLSPSPVVAPVPAPVAEPVPQVQSTAPRTPAPPLGAGRTAQDIRRAYMVDDGPRKKRRRTLAIAGVGIALVVVVAGLYFKILESLAPSLTPVAAPTPNVVPEPAPVQVVAAPVVSAPVAPALPINVSAPVPPDIEPLTSKKKLPAQAAPQATPQASLSSVPVPTSPAAATSTAIGVASDNEVVLDGGATKQSFASKIRGPGPLELGYSALLAGRLDDAAQQYTQALKSNSEERDALLGLAYIAQKKGQNEDAQLLYRRVLRQEPGNAIAGAALLALDSESDSARAASRARELAMRQPDSAASMAVAGNAAARSGQMADAVQLFARAQSLEPGNPMHAYNHAVALDRLGQFGAAALQYEKALKLAANTSTANGRAFSVDTVQERLAQLRQALGSRAEAVK